MGESALPFHLMSFDPNFPTANTLADANVMRAQLQALKALIDAVFTNVVIDEVITLPAGSPATVTASLVAGVLHLRFGIPEGPQGQPGPAGSNGNDGAQGPQGGPGEVTNAALVEAIAGTARNPVGLPSLGTPFADPDAESLRQFCLALAGALFRVPT